MHYSLPLGIQIHSNAIGYGRQDAGIGHHFFWRRQSALSCLDFSFQIEVVTFLFSPHLHRKHHVSPVRHRRDR